MRTFNTLSSSTHEQVRLLLPWYVNGTLHGDERRLVEEHCRVCTACTREQADLRQLSVYSRQAAVPEFSAQAAFGRLQQRIDGETKANRFKKRYPRYLPKFLNGTAGLTRFLSPKPIALAAAAVLLLFFAPAGLLFTLDSWTLPDAGYRTLSSGRNSPENFGGNDIQVIFAENVDAGKRSRLFASVRGEIIAGPNARGLYVVRIAAPQGAKPDLVEALAVLRREAGVLFAEPALPPHSAFSAQDGRA